jgi:hypothetical protein
MEVECFAGDDGEQAPSVFYVGTKRHEVKQVLDRWSASDHRYFRCLSDDGRVYVLGCDDETGEWEISSHHEGDELHGRP